MLTRPAPGEPDEDIVSPEGNRTTLRDIYMVLRRAHYTVLLNAETVSQTDAAAECVRARVDVDGGRHGQGLAKEHTRLHFRSPGASKLTLMCHDAKT